ncbi:MAG: hypothetical protein KIG16_03335 [Eubacteriales bacterium]|nr:hypothetical protein [Eubacteriales bacterium]
MQNDNIFVLVLSLEQYQNTTLLSQPICGRTMQQWVTAAAAPFKTKSVIVSPTDDIITIFKNHLTGATFTVITYDDMPLLTTQDITDAVDYCFHKNVPAVKLPRGWVFNTELVAQSETFPVTEFHGARQENYLVAFNHAQIAKIRAIMQERINEQHLKNGVNIIDPNHTYIDAEVVLEKNVTVEPNAHLIGKTTVHSGTHILDGCHITDAVIGQDCEVGPYAHIRPNSSIGNKCRIGNYVEIKRSRIGDGTKVAHMTYVGDSTLGKDCNVGCGVIFCNYNGKTKSNCLVGDKTFIGSNSCLIAPVQIGDHAYIAAGSVITDELPAHALGISRARQAIKEHYVAE